MLKCREVVSQADALLAGDLSWRQRAAMRFHLLMCHHCGRYVRQFKQLLRAIARMHGMASEAEVAQVMKNIETRNNERTEP